MGNNNTHCCTPTCNEIDPCLVSGSYSACVGADRIVWATCSGTVYSCTGIGGCPDAGCDIGEQYTIAASVGLQNYYNCGGGGGASCDSCTVTVGDWQFVYTGDDCQSEYLSGADSTYNGVLGSCEIQYDDPCDIFDNCGDCFYSHYSPATHGYIRVTAVGTPTTSDLNWYSAFTLSADLRLYQPSGASGCGGYRSGDTSLWKITAYQVFAGANIRLRWYFRDCCYQEENMSAAGVTSDGGDSLSGYTTCINSKTDETGISATEGADNIFTELRLEDYNVEYELTTTGVAVYNQRCPIERQSSSITVDGYQLFVDSDDGAPVQCTGHNTDCPHCDGDGTFTSNCYTDYAQIVTISDAASWDGCAGGSTFVNWQCEERGTCEGGDCDCEMGDVTITVTK